MIVNGKNYRTVWMENSSIFTIEQRLLPHKFKIVELKTTKEAAAAIRDMVIRGAPAIGGMAAFAMALSAVNFKGNNIDNFLEHLNKDAELIRSARPTANDLFHAVDYISNKIKTKSSVEEAKKAAAEAANEYAKNSIQACKRIGEFGNKILKNNDNILTHCNAGALATIDYGTALAPVRAAHYDRKKIHVFIDETRPRGQGASLTAWELAQEKIPHSVIADNAAGYFMKKGEINIVITGADRIAANGDTANKIGTYEKAVLAKENNVPFYIAAPLSTIDLKTETGDGIKIEERDEEEISYVFGWNGGKLMKVRITPEESRARNPAFDVTPAKYIKGIITEKGIVKPGNLKSLF